MNRVLLGIFLTAVQIMAGMWLVTTFMGMVNESNSMLVAIGFLGITVTMLVVFWTMYRTTTKFFVAPLTALAAEFVDGPSSKETK